MNELVVRCYPSGRRVRGLFSDGLFMSFEDDFSSDGGLTKYKCFGIGFQFYKYEDMTLLEYLSLDLNLNLMVCMSITSGYNNVKLSKLIKNTKLYGIVDRKRKLEKILK